MKLSADDWGIVRSALIARMNYIDEQIEACGNYGVPQMLADWRRLSDEISDLYARLAREASDAEAEAC